MYLKRLCFKNHFPVLFYSVFTSFCSLSWQAHLENCEGLLTACPNNCGIKIASDKVMPLNQFRFLTLVSFSALDIKISNTDSTVNDIVSVKSYVNRLFDPAWKPWGSRSVRFSSLQRLWCPFLWARSKKAERGWVPAGLLFPWSFSILSFASLLLSNVTLNHYLDLKELFKLRHLF